MVKKGLSVRLSAPSAFGEAALITDEMREATVTALEPCQLLLLTGNDMDGLDVRTTRMRSTAALPPPPRAAASLVCT
jgi:hypothetical protein